MKSSDVGVLHELLLQETINTCGHEERKGQLSMSWLSLPVEEIVQRVKNGHHEGLEKKLKFYQGTRAEEGMRTRLKAVLAFSPGQAIGEWKEPRLLTAYEGRLTGHTDGAIGDTVVEIKTIPDRRAMEEMQHRGKLPFKVYAQVQSYIFWGRFRDGLVIYETRVEGEQSLVPVMPNRHVQEELRQKAEQVIKLL